MKQNSKIIKLCDLAKVKKQKAALCHGHFNILHPGHIRYLKNASQQGERLIVSVISDRNLQDSGYSNLYSQKERASSVSSLEIVDQVILLKNETLTDVIKKISPSTLVLGKEFEVERFDEVEEAVKLCLKNGVKVVFHAGDIQYASSKFLHSTQSDLEKEQIKIFRDSCRKNQLTAKSLLQSINSLEKSSILVIGDTIVDRFVACDAEGMSSEAPVIVARELDTQYFIGGAAIVALHAKRLGANCHFISVTGSDKSREFLEENLSKEKVSYFLAEDYSRPTTLKTRYTIDNQKMFRVSRLIKKPLSENIENQILKEIQLKAKAVDAIIVSDFVYGVITPRVLEEISRIAKAQNILLIGDLQCSSQIGNISKFKNFDLLTPTEKEARIAIGSSDEGIEWVSNQLIAKTNCKHLIAKLGSDGLIAYTCHSSSRKRQYFPALNANPLDTAGAGDSLLACAACSLSVGQTLEEAAAIGTLVASLVVGNLGNIPVYKDQLLEYLMEVLHES